jgi:hypothetical protein
MGDGMSCDEQSDDLVAQTAATVVVIRGQAMPG